MAVKPGALLADLEIDRCFREGSGGIESRLAPLAIPVRRLH